jgi:hypothetical protein
MNEERYPVSTEQLELQDELDAAEGFDGWDIFEPADDEGQAEAA